MIILLLYPFRLGQFWYVGSSFQTVSGALLRAPVQGGSNLDPIWIEVSGSMESPPSSGWQYHAASNSRLSIFNINPIV